MALSIGFRIFSFLPSCYSSYGALNSYPGGTFTHCSCQPSLDAHCPLLIRRTSQNAVSDQCTSRRVYAHLNFLPNVHPTSAPIGEACPGQVEAGMCVPDKRALRHSLEMTLLTCAAVDMSRVILRTRRVLLTKA